MKSVTPTPLLDMSRLISQPVLKRLVRFFKSVVHAFLGVNRFNDLYESQIRGVTTDNAFATIQKAFEVTTDVSDIDKNRIPREGPLVVVANHPFGGIDGILLTALIKEVRPDTKVFANHLLKAIPEIADDVIAANVFGRQAVSSNARALREAMDHLRSGGALVIFPAGGVSYFQPRRLSVADVDWNAHVGALIRKTEATVLPVCIRGRNSWFYQCTGMFSAAWRSLMLVREMINKRGRRVGLTVGQPLAWSRLKEFDDNKKLMSYLRHLVLVMRARQSSEVSLHTASADMQAIVNPVDPELMARDVAQLDGSAEMVKRGEFSVYITRADNIPYVLQEIGRLREITFRQVGEGTGREIDLDRHDNSYLHLFCWNHDTREVVGGYRLGCVDEVQKHDGLYTRTMFDLRPAFYAHVHDGIELGRSFIRSEYQEAFGILSLLWKGICQFVALNPQYRKLFGPVSVSRDYQNMSRNLIVQYLNRTRKHPLSRHVKARHPYRIPPRPHQGRRAVREANGMEEISMMISSVENDGKGVPVLLKHYLKLDAQLLSFNVDPHFQDSLDGLILVDFDVSNARMIRRLMGSEAYDRYMKQAPKAVMRKAKKRYQNAV